MRRELQKGNRPREAATVIHKLVDRASCSHPALGFQDSKNWGNGDLEGGSLRYSGRQCTDSVAIRGLSPNEMF